MDPARLKRNGCASLVLVAAGVRSAGVAIVAIQKFRSDTKARIAGREGGADIPIVAWGVVWAGYQVTAEVGGACTGLARLSIRTRAVGGWACCAVSSTARVFDGAGIAIVAWEALGRLHTSHTDSIGLAYVFCGARNAVVTGAIFRDLKNTSVGCRGARV